MSAKYRFRVFFDWSAENCLWPDNKAAYEKFGAGYTPIEEYPLSQETKWQVVELSTWHDGALNWYSPLDPGPFRQEECDRFNIAAKELFETLERELGEDFELVNEQEVLNEDPRLDQYLAEFPDYIKQVNPATRNWHRGS